MTKFGASYYGNRYFSHAKRDMARLAETCDYVVHAVSETDLIFHKAVLARIFAETRKAGLEIWVDPWAFGGVFGGEAVSHFLLKHRDAWQVFSDGRVVPAACLNRPEWRAFVKEWMLNMRDFGAKVVFWDEPHISFDFHSERAGVYACRCDVCQDLFKRRYGALQPHRLNDDARRFRRETLRDFLREMMRFAHEQKMTNALCLYAVKGVPEYDAVWREAAALPELDIFGCDPYWRWPWRGNHDPTQLVGDYARYVVESARPNNKETQIWIQAMRLPAGTEHEIGPACEAAVAAGVSHLAAWSYDGGELLDTVLAERPEAVWRAVEDTYRRLRERR